MVFSWTRYLLTIGKCRRILITICVTTNAVCTTRQCWKQRYQSVGDATEESRSRFNIFLTNENSSSAFQMRSAQNNFHTATSFATQTNVEHGRISQNPSTDRCRSLPILKMSNATLFKHFARRKCRFFTFTKRVSRRTMKLSIPDDSYGNCVRFAVEIVSLWRF